MNRTRDPFFDAVKGASIIGVILIHTTGSWVDSDWGILLRQLINFPVFVFVAMAGYFVGRQNEGPGSIGQFWRKKAVRLLPPLGVAVVLYAMTKVWMGGGLRRVSFLGVMPDFLFGFGYFVIVLLQLYLVWPWWQRWLRSDGVKLAAAGVFNLAAMALLYYLIWQDPERKGVAVPIPAAFLISWLWAFTLGDVLRRRPGLTAFLRCHRYAMLTGLVLSTLCAFGEGLGWFELHYRLLAGAQIKLSATIQSTMLVLTLFAFYRQGMKPPRILCNLGENSYFIYLFHWFFIIFFRKVLVVCNLRSDWAHTILLATLVTAGCGLTAFLLQRYGSAKLKMLGGTG